MKNILIACEESQTICKEFRKSGFNCFSCDLQKCSGGFPEFHIVGDCLKIINGNCDIVCENGDKYFIAKWDLIIAHPPCTFLAVCGNKYYNKNIYGESAIKRAKERAKAITFFKQIAKANCKRIAIENPIGIMSTEYGKPTQIIQPFYFGDLYTKKTCLWLKNLPTLKYHLDKTLYDKARHNTAVWWDRTWSLPKNERQRERSKTFPGIAKAIVKQWGDII